MASLWRHLLLRLAPCVAIAALMAVYAPVLRTGLIAEDFQFCLKGAKVAVDPGELLRPLQLVWRPGTYALFSLLVATAGSNAIWYRLLQLLSGAALAGLGWGVLRRIASLGPWTAAALTVAWLASPLASEPLCGEVALTGHLVFGCCLLCALMVRAPSGTAGRRIATVAAVVLAAGFKEDWVVIPLLFFLQDLWLFHLRPTVAARRAAPWAAGIAAYLAVYGAVCGFGYRGLYSAGWREILAKGAMTVAAFSHLAPPSTWQFSAAVHDRPWAVVGGLALLLGVICLAWLRRSRRVWFLLAAAAATSLPTALSAGQTARFTFLPWLFFLAAVGTIAHDLPVRQRLRVPVTVALALLLASVIVHDVRVARGDVADWAQFERLTRRLEGETKPIVEAALRDGKTIAILRGDDARPWRSLVNAPRGQQKFFMPRPDDPYGVVSLSALLSWGTFSQGWVLERTFTLPAETGVVAFIHDEGGFHRLPRLPEVRIGRPVGSREGWPGVLLVPRPWMGFSPVAFP